MDRNTIKTGLLLSLCCLAMLMVTGCEFDVATPKYYDQTAQPATPTITQLVPARATAGVYTITIQGQNFSSESDRNQVYFGNSLAEIISTTPTALIVRRPAILGTVPVKVVSYDALLVANAPSNYTIDTVLTSFGNFLDGKVETAMAVDKNGNIFVFQDTPPNSYKVSPSGERTLMGALGKTIIEAVVAPDGQVVLFGRSLVIQKVDPSTGTVTDWTRLTRQSAYGDFDKYGNLWAGGQSNGDLWCLKPDLTKAASGKYAQGSISKIRVFNDYVYVDIEGAPTDPVSAIYRSKILDNAGTLDAKELVFDRTKAGVYANSTFKDFALSANGDLYIATDHANTILMVKNGTIDVLYKGIVPSVATKLMWYGDYLYMLLLKDGKGDLLRINMGEPGAPYLGG